MTVTKRQIEIIEYIMNNVSGITGDKLAKYFGVSSRTIRNDILQINSALKGDPLLCQTEGRLLSPSIKASKRIGYYITQEDMEYFRAVLSGGSDRNHVIAPTTAATRFWATPWKRGAATYTIWKRSCSYPRRRFGRKY